MRIFCFSLKIWAKNCTLYTAKYSNIHEGQLKGLRPPIFLETKCPKYLSFHQSETHTCGLPHFGPSGIAAPDLCKPCVFLLVYTEVHHQKHPYESDVYYEGVFENIFHLLSKQ